MSQFLSWVHFGDLHITSAKAESYLDFEDLIAEANKHIEGHVDFAFLPGDNTDDGVAEQYQAVRRALDRLRIPAYIITGDHDRKAGTLEPFRRYLEPRLHRAVERGGVLCLFLNAMDGRDAKSFDFGEEQMAWLRERLQEASRRSQRTVVFTHLYPSKLETQGAAVSELLRASGVALVEMGHTHYNELANDGVVLYAATRSTGQIEEGPPGFSVTCIDGPVVSWKFKPRGEWPLLMITSPAEKKLMTNPAAAAQVVHGVITVRARVWGATDATTMPRVSVDGGAPVEMTRCGQAWEAEWDSATVANGDHELVVSGYGGRDCITIYVHQDGYWPAPVRDPLDCRNTIGAYREKGIWGTQLGPNENGTKGSWPSWRGRSGDHGL